MAAKKPRKPSPAPRRAKPRVRPALRPVGVIRSTLKARVHAPKQGDEGAPDAWLEVEEAAALGLRGVQAGDEMLLVTWLHQARRDVLLVHPRSEPGSDLKGVFTTRSPDRPNPLGLHQVTVRRVQGSRLRVGPIEAIDGTPVVDIKPLHPCRAAPRGSAAEATASRLAELSAWRGTAMKRLRKLVRGVLKGRSEKAGVR